MSSSDVLQTFLTLYLADDDSTVYHTPTILSGLHSCNIDASPSLSKWANRVNSLIHSRDSRARWSGLCLALETSKHSRPLLMEFAQTWVAVVLPFLSRPEPLAVWKASMRLLYFVFTSTIDLSEFQRQVVIPNVPKFSSAVISLSEKQTDEEFNTVCLDILSSIVPLFPTLHKQLHTSLSTLSLKFLDGSAFMTPSRIMASACRLHACLCVTGGKSSSTSLWRKSLDETIGYCGRMLAALRSSGDSPVSVPLHLDRLRCGVELLRYLLCYPVARPVVVPVAALVDLSVYLISGIDAEEMDGANPAFRALQSSINTCATEIGCRFLQCLSQCVKHRFAPHLTRIVSAIAYRLEGRTSIPQRLPYIRLLPTLLECCLPPCDPLLVGRILKTLLPAAASILHRKGAEVNRYTSQDKGGKKGRKRARGYEDAEVFNVVPDVLCKSSEEDELILAVIDALSSILRIPGLPIYLQSITARMFISILLSVPDRPSSSISRDPSMKNKILDRVKGSCAQVASGSSSAVSQTLPLIIDTISGNAEQLRTPEVRLMLDLMVHPRLPPLLRSLPSLDTIALSLTEEGKDERQTRESLALQSAADDSPHNSELQDAIGEHSMPDVNPTGEEYTLGVVHSALTSSNEEKFARVESTRNSHNSAVQPDPPKTTTQVVTRPDKEGHLPTVMEALKQGPTTLGTVGRSKVAMTVDEDDDGDIEIPPLNMDSDSDPDD